LIKRGEALVAITIPNGFEKDFLNIKGKIEVSVDESNFNVAITSMNYIKGVAYVMQSSSMVVLMLNRDTSSQLNRG